MVKTVAILFLFAFSIEAQVNLVLNPSFEQLKSCPNGLNDADSAKYWDWVNSSIPSNNACKGELYTTCCVNPSVSNCGIPYNRGGYQKPRTGNTYIALETIYASPPTVNSNKRDYLKGQLSNILQVGKNYCLTFYYNTANTITYATNRFGAYVDNGTVATYDCCKDMPVTPQAENNPAVFMTDTMNWVKIQSRFTAIGNENTITLGNFVDSATIQFQLFNSNGFTAPYYLIDDVSLLPMDLPAYAGRDTSITQNDSVYIGRTHEIGLDDDCIWYVLGNSNAIDTMAGLWIKPNATTSYAVEQNICGTITYDTVVVTVSPLGINKLAASNSQLMVYPNPSSGDIFIRGSDLTDKQWNVEITDVTGRLVLQNTYQVNQGSIKLSTQLNNGVYFIQVVNSSGIIQMQKIVINN